MAPIYRKLVTGMMFPLNSAIKQALKPLVGDKKEGPKMWFVTNLVSGALAGGVSHVFVYPIVFT